MSPHIPGALKSLVSNPGRPTLEAERITPGYRSQRQDSMQDRTGIETVADRIYYLLSIYLQCIMQ